MSIALVGFNNSEFDAFVLFDLMNLVDFQIKPEHLDLIDLNNRRDFLKENKEYNIVVLNYIFRLSPEELEKEPDGYLAIDPSFKTSPLHNSENWRKRLIETKAKEIYIFGCFEESEITPSYIGPLEGYNLKSIKKQSGSIWIYKLN